MTASAVSLIQDSSGWIQLIECGLERPSVIIEGKYRTEIAERGDGPAGRPVKEIRAALEAVDVGEESSHERGSRQQCQRDEALVGQGLGQFSVPSTDGSVTP